MTSRQKGLVFGATSRHMEAQHLELVNDELKNKKAKIENLQKETTKIKEDAQWGDRWDKLEAMEKVSRAKNSAKNLQKALKTLNDSPFFSRLDFQEGISRKDICYISKGNISITVLPVYVAKGLEFDAAIVINTFHQEREKELFYTACTRAQHKLVVYNVKQRK